MEAVLNCILVIFSGENLPILANMRLANTFINQRMIRVRREIVISRKMTGSGVSRLCFSKSWVFKADWCVFIAGYVGNGRRRAVWIDPDRKNT